eukprot:TRINITY_DN30975_c0_g1_i1.p1 TRINITY_DN30975_c0_g1~~TRINITY_DN30975_c0_g1_i1.p1  ORF type:complete len:222 (+),score=37.38 TRINITY_DN30975_c0_g1_i1:114-779(+)
MEKDPSLRSLESIDSFSRSRVFLTDYSRRWRSTVDLAAPLLEESVSVASEADHPCPPSTHAWDPPDDTLRRELLNEIRQRMSLFKRESKDDQVPIQRLNVLLASLGRPIDQQEYRDLTIRFAPTGYFSADSVLEMVRHYDREHASPTFLDDIRPAFSIMDVSHSGFISGSDMFDVLTKIGLKLPQEDGQAFLDDFTNSDSTISLDDVVRRIRVRLSTPEVS